MKISNEKELQNIAMNHSVDIDCKDFMKIYKECTREPYFFTIDTTLPASNPLRFRKKIYFIKMAVPNQLKTIDN